MIIYWSEFLESDFSCPDGNENFRGSTGHTADRQTERGGSADNNPLPVIRRQCLFGRLLLGGAGRHTVQTHRSWAKVKLLVDVVLYDVSTLMSFLLNILSS